MNRRLLPIVAFVFVDVLGFSLILPLLPYLAKSFGASPSLVGGLLTSNALAQLLCAPLLGRLSDMYGRRALLILCLLGTVASFVLLSISTSLSMVFLSRILDGVLGGNVSLAYAYIADVTTPAQRTQGHGWLGAAFGAAFVFGPALGGSLVGYGYHVPALAAAGLSLLNLAAVAAWLPESLPREKRLKTGSVWAFWDLTGGAFQPNGSQRLRILLALRFAFSLVFAAWESIFGLFNAHVHGMEARRSSYLMAGVAVLYAFVQGGLMRPLSKRYGDGTLVAVSMAAVAASMAVWATASSLSVSTAAMAIFGPASGIANTVLGSAVSKEVPPDRQGGAMSVSASISAFTRVLAPYAAGVLIDVSGYGAPGVVCAVISVAASATAALALGGGRLNTEALTKAS